MKLSQRFEIRFWDEIFIADFHIFHKEAKISYKSRTDQYNITKHDKNHTNYHSDFELNTKNEVYSNILWEVCKFTLKAFFLLYSYLFQWVLEFPNIHRRATEVSGPVTKRRASDSWDRTHREWALHFVSSVLPGYPHFPGRAHCCLLYIHPHPDLAVSSAWFSEVYQFFLWISFSYFFFFLACLCQHLLPAQE